MSPARPLAQGAGVLGVSSILGLHDLKAMTSGWVLIFGGIHVFSPGDLMNTFRIRFTGPSAAAVKRMNGSAVCVLGTPVFLLALACAGAAQAASQSDMELKVVNDRLSLSGSPPPLSTGKPASSKLTQGLDALAEEYRNFQQELVLGRVQPGEFVSLNSQLQLVNESVMIDAVAIDENPQALVRALEDLGASIIGVAGRMVSARLPLEQLQQLETLEELHFARPVMAMRQSGLVTSQGDMAQQSDRARAESNLDGRGSLVGILSDSFNRLPGNGQAADVASGDLPADVQILRDLAGTACSDEGRAMAQIVHDVAPGARLAFHTGVEGEAAFAQAIRSLAQAGADIIVDDIRYHAEPMFQDGLIAQAIDAVTSTGVAYFSSAGNQGRDAYEAPFRDSGIPGRFGGGNFHDFDPGPGVQTRLQIVQGSPTTYVLQWSNPFASVSGPPGATADIDICFWTPQPDILLGCVAGDNITRDPLEIANVTGSGNLWISIEKFSGPDPSLIKLETFGDINFVDAVPGINAGTISGHANAATANAVGAAAYFLTPAFGQSPPVLNPFSSAGNTPILFNTAGNPIVQIRQKPEFTAPDGGNNTFFGTDFEGDGFPNFFGTSAAAPHAAGVAALMRQRDPNLSPAAITRVLQSTAIDIQQRRLDSFQGPNVDIGVGFDNDSGAGLIDARAATAAVGVNIGGGGGGALGPIAVLLLLLAAAFKVRLSRR